MRILKQEVYFPIIIGIHFIFWTIDLYFYEGSFKEISSDTLFFGELTNASWKNPHRIIGEIFSSWVVTVFAFNFLMSTRAKWVENIFGGLDKMYLIHRRSGIIAIVLLFAHFLIVPRDLVEFTIGKPLGFYAFILIIIGVILSAAPVFKKKIPYHKWVNFHKLMGLFYVLGVIHGILVDSLIKELPITRIYVFGMALIGVVAWFYKAFLFKKINKPLNYKVESVTYLGYNMTELILVTDAKPLHFKAGQFAFFTFPSIHKHEQHPFTISSHPNSNYLKVTVKGLGDYTNNLDQKIAHGDRALVEGPYGKFSHAISKEKKQIWIAGGIGITPFISLIQDNYTTNITLYWCVYSIDEAIYRTYFENFEHNNPHFKVIIWESKTKGRITLNDLNLKTPKQNAFLLCGPETLKTSIIKALKQEGVKNQDISDEEFTFR